MRSVAIGGGHGASATLRAASLYADEVAGIISVADDGGSSGRLARELGVLPMGDIRNCLAALAPESDAVDVFQHRFPSGRLEGHVVGNLIMAAVAQETGDFIAAIRHAARMVGSRGRIVPPTLDSVKLMSEIDGEVVEGQVNVATSPGKITAVFLDPPDPKPYFEALDLIDSADQLLLGPGSLFTSVLPPLLVPELKDALVRSRAKKIYICNLVAPPGETADFDAAAHVAAVFAHLGPEAVDVIVFHRGRPPLSESPVVEADESELTAMGVEVVVADLIPEDRSPRHDPERLASVLKLTY